MLFTPTFVEFCLNFTIKWSSTKAADDGDVFLPQIETPNQATFHDQTRLCVCVCIMHVCECIYLLVLIKEPMG